MKTIHVILTIIVTIWLTWIFLTPKKTSEYIIDNPGNLYDLKDSCEIELDGKFFVTDVYANDDWVSTSCYTEHGVAFTYGFRAQAERHISGLQGPFLSEFDNWLSEDYKRAREALVGG